MKRLVLLDGMRGYFLVFMMLNHLNFQGGLALSKFNHAQLGFVQDAQGFIFLSGLIAGLCYAPIQLSGGLVQMQQRLLRRAGDLYLYAAAVIAVILVIAVLLPDSQSFWGSQLGKIYDDPSTQIAASVLLLYQPTYMDILPQYIVYLLAAPFLIRMVVADRWRTVLGGSLLLWLAVQLGWHLPLIDAAESFGGSALPGLQLRTAFNPLAWQILFVGGLTLGAAFAAGRLDIRRMLSPERTELRNVALGFIALFFVFRLGFTYDLVSESLAARFRAFENRTEFSLVFAANFAAMAYVAAWTVVAGPRSESPWAQSFGRLLNGLFELPWLAFLGRHSLQVYAFHVVVAYLVIALDWRFGPFPEAGRTAIAALAIASLAVPASLHARFIAWRRRGAVGAPAQTGPAPKFPQAIVDSAG